MEHYYTPRYRPAHGSALPTGWWYVEKPRDFGHLRPDLPVSRYRHGTIAYDRVLTQEEREQAELDYADSPSKAIPVSPYSRKD